MELIGEALSSSSLRLMWALPPIPGLTEESVSYSVSAYEVPTATDMVYLTAAPSATILSLHPYYSYICRVAIQDRSSNTYPYSDNITVITHEAGEILSF